MNAIYCKLFINQTLMNQMWVSDKCFHLVLLLSNINFRQGFLFDVIVLVYTGEDASDDDLAEAEDVNNSGSHINDQYNVRDENGNVLVNVGHPTADPDIYLSPLVAKCIKPHQVCSCLCTLILSCWMLIQGSPFKQIV